MAHHAPRIACLILSAFTWLTTVAVPAVRAATAPERLNAVLLDPLTAGATARVAVSWGGGSAALVEASVDGEVIAASRVEPGLEIMTLELPANLGTTTVEIEALDAEAPAATSCRWSDNFALGEPASEVFAAVVHDDGSGPSLFIGGMFENIGSRIARWDGTDWSPLIDDDSAVGGVGGEFDVLDTAIYALAVYDDGSGGALYAGGRFDSAGGATAHHIARWDGTNWTPLIDDDSLVNGVDDAVYTLAAYDDGTGEALYVGGDFASAGGTTAARIARWDGADWTALIDDDSAGNGIGPDSSWLSALAVYDDGSGHALYAGGHFETAGGTTAYNIARWDGTDWMPLIDDDSAGNGVVGDVDALAVYDDGGAAALYVGGKFLSAGGTSAHHLARWDGSDWTAFGHANHYVSSFAVYDDGTGSALYAGGRFVEVGGIFAVAIARWDGTTWTALIDDDTGVNGVLGSAFHVYTLVAHDDGAGDALYPGGRFTSAGGEPANYIARWDGADWTPAIDSDAPGIALSRAVLALATFNDGAGNALFVGGHFESAGDTTVNRIARWNGAGWAPLIDISSSGNGVNGSFPRIQALAAFDDGNGEALYAAGLFSNAGGSVANNIARWDGDHWTPLIDSATAGNGTNGEIVTLATYDDGTGEALYVGGIFDSAGGKAANNIARWDGSEWTPILDTLTFNGVNDDVRTIATFDDGTGVALYAGGYFTMAGATVANSVARWDGADWIALIDDDSFGNGISGDTLPAVFALLAFDDGSGEALYAGGRFNMAGGSAANNIARWDGNDWTPVIDDDSIGNGVSGGDILTYVFALVAYVDEAGDALYVGGNFTTAGSAPANSIARWDGADWTPVIDSETNGNGVANSIFSFAVYNDGQGATLYAGGSLTAAGHRDSHRIAALSCGSAIGCSFTNILHTDDFESEDFSSWDFVRNPQGDLTVDAASALEQSFGLRAHIDHRTDRKQRLHYVLKTHADVPNYCWSLLFDPNSITMPNGKMVRIWGARGDNNRRLLDMSLRKIGGNFLIGLQAYKDGPTAASLGFHAISDGPVLLSGEWSQTTGAGNDGVLRLFIDGTEVAALTNINNMTRQVRTVGMGNLGLFRKGTLGDVYFDAFVSGWAP